MHVCVWVGGEEVRTARGGSLAAAKSDIKPGAPALSEEWERVCGGSGGLEGGVKSNIFCLCMKNTFPFLCKDCITLGSTFAVFIPDENKHSFIL